jgi:hypothetical protein
VTSVAAKKPGRDLHGHGTVVLVLVLPITLQYVPYLHYISP